ncbi:ATP-grasp domain-containing protein [Pseudomonas sp. QD4]|uniref:ATP-grasp domain-containing protein n=1 Tax=Pseudomonas sp. QD4 TaxID=3368618 RepID=UPI003BA0BF37
MSIQKKVLLVGSSFSAAPIFFALKRHGFHVSVCGNFAADPCHQYADQSFYIDYSNPDALMQVVEEHHFDYIVPSCNDKSYMSSVPIAEKYGYVGFDKSDTALAIHTKGTFRQVAEQHSLSVPQYIRHSRGQPLPVDLLSFPLLVKPVDSFSGRGMTRVDTTSELEEAIAYAFATSQADEVILEAFVDGALHSHSAFIENQKVVQDFFADEFCTVYPYQVDCSNHPSVLSGDIKERVRSEINLLADKLGLADGLMHTQFIVDGDKFWIIESMRRCPGDLYGSMVELSTGVDYADYYIRGFISKKLPSAQPAHAVKYVGRHTISTTEPLVYFSFSNSIPSDRVDIVSLKNSGDRLKVAPFDKLAIVFAEFSDKQTMLATSPYLADFVKIKRLGGPL